MAHSDSEKDADRVEHGWQERAKRDSLFLMTAIARETGEPLGNARVRNLSATGFMAECDFPLGVNDRLTVEIRGVGDRTGQVVWCRDKRIGFAFDLAIDPQMVRKPVHVGPADNLPPYLRHLNRSTQFKR